MSEGVGDESSPLIPAAERALEAARRAWGQSWEPSYSTRAPGRLELLGNHVDYNGGPVLAAAIDRDTICLVGHSDRPGVNVLLCDVARMPSKIELEELTNWRNPEASPQALDYVRGVVATASASDSSVSNAVEIAVAGDVPIGLGLSSSASLCVALTLALHDPAPNGRDLVLRAQEAEHRAGTPCGTMDQAASVGGNVILYDSANVSWTAVTPDLDDYVFAVADSGVSRSLGLSSYPRRVEESKQALVAVNALLGIDSGSLAEIDPAALPMLERSSDDVLSDTLKRRIRHVVTEVARVRDGLRAMQRGDWNWFGALMSESGQSSATDYQISHPRVEELVAIAKSVPGVAGARMMGGGEGGIALVLLRQEVVSDLVTCLENRYYARHPVRDQDPVKVFRFSPGAARSQ